MTGLQGGDYLHELVKCFAGLARFQFNEVQTKRSLPASFGDVPPDRDVYGTPVRYLTSRRGG